MTHNPLCIIKKHSSNKEKEIPEKNKQNKANNSRVRNHYAEPSASRTEMLSEHRSHLPFYS